MATAYMQPRSNDPVLFDLVRKGNRNAFMQLTSGYDATIYRVALRITGNSADAEDVRQQTLLKAFAHFDQFRDGFRFAAWITQIAANESVSLLRRRRDSQMLHWEDVAVKEPEGTAPEPPSKKENPEQIYSRVEQRRMLADALAELDPSLRKVCLLRDVENLSTEETADQLGLTPQTVRTRLFRGRMKLRARLRDCFQRPDDTAEALPMPAFGD
ncbi:MAG TPA: sigma-70 family RNA polymerase sigma factor [Candidatus Acidoferrales bacterium]|nr:sigma-70 family RNA polymerase sigma factor [Candidatus Acidoferrales bacterium]